MFIPWQQFVISSYSRWSGFALSPVHVLYALVVFWWTNIPISSSSIGAKEQNPVQCSSVDERWHRRLPRAISSIPILSSSCIEASLLLFFLFFYVLSLSSVCFFPRRSFLAHFPWVPGTISAHRRKTCHISYRVDITRYRDPYIAEISRCCCCVRCTKEKIVLWHSSFPSRQRTSSVLKWRRWIRKLRCRVGLLLLSDWPDIRGDRRDARSFTFLLQN